jgi:hypothetical protein
MRVQDIEEGSMNKQLLAVLALVVVAGTARAQQDPLEAMAAQQVSAQAPGAVQVAPFFKGSTPKSDWTSQLEEGKCYWWSGVGGPGVKKLAIYLWGPDNKRAADMKSSNPNATLAYCATMNGLYHFQAKIQGSGYYAVGLYAKKALPQSAPPPVATPQKKDLGPLCDKQASAAAPGARRTGDFFDGHGSSIGHKDHTDYSVEMESGQCYWVVGCGEPGEVKALSLFLWGPDNKRITEAKPDSPNVMVGHCATMSGMFKVQAKVSSGGGDYKVGIYAKPKK